MSKKTKKIILIILFSFIVFLPSFTNFFTHDDFFHFKISRPESIKEFASFFNPLNNPEGWNYYRPLTTQVFYFVGANILNYKPLFMHILNFFFFALVIGLVYKLIFELTQKQETALTATFLYALSSSHFSKLYFLGAHQEIGLAFNFIFSCYLFTKFLLTQENYLYRGAILLFIFSLMSKETAVVLPLVLGLIFFYLKLQNRLNFKWTKLITLLLPFAILDLIYGFFKLQAGLPQGDSYIWDFSPRILNTLAWYGLWSLNLPEMFVDFIGPGLNINQRLFLWKPWVQIVIVLFGLQILVLLIIFFNQLKYLFEKYITFIFGFVWFVVTLLPVVFLPWHKFVFYLTLPMIGVVFVLSQIIKNSRLKIVFLVFFCLTSFFSLVLSYKTHWVVQGAKTARRVKDHIDNNYADIKEHKQIIFYNIQSEQDLPWLPTNNLKNALSGNNFFEVFYDGEINAVYLEELGNLEKYQGVRIPAGKFLEY